MQDSFAIKEYWEKPQTVSLRDENLRLLEQRMIETHLEPTESLLEIGCGDCVNTLNYSRSSQSTLAMDYSRAMLKKAKMRVIQDSSDRIHLLNGDLRSLRALKKKFHTIISQRCLINLSSWEEQREALLIVLDKLQDRGIFLLLETTHQGLETLNGLRQRAGFAPIPQPWHNQNFDLPQLLEFLKKNFQIEVMKDFSLYFMNTRVLSPLLGLVPGTPPAIKMDGAARILSEIGEISGIQGIGPQIFLKLRKKECG
jgi:ubiquinone/menaquinone biosynthesis C-methylase UbiE